MGALLCQGEGTLKRLSGTNDEMDKVAFLPMKATAGTANHCEWHV